MPSRGHYEPFGPLHAHVPGALALAARAVHRARREEGRGARRDRARRGSPERARRSRRTARSSGSSTAPLRRSCPRDEDPSMDERLQALRRPDRGRRARTSGPGQDVHINSIVENAALTRAVARSAYEAGARYVDVWYFDEHARRARIDHAPQDSLDLDAALARRAERRDRAARGRAHRDLRRALRPDAARRRRPRARRARPHAPAAELAADLARRRRQLDGLQRAEPRLGADALRRARRRAAVDGDRALGAARRGRSGRCLGRALRARSSRAARRSRAGSSARCTSAAPAPTCASA